MPKTSIHLLANGERHTLNVWPMSRLLDVIREDLPLTGTKEGCGEGECGACSILLNGQLTNGCLGPALQADRAEITTIEGIVVPGVRWSPKSLPGMRRRPVRDLYARDGDGRGELDGRAATPVGGGNSASARRQPLPLHRLPADFRGRHSGVRARPCGWVRLEKLHSQLRGVPPRDVGRSARSLGPGAGTVAPARRWHGLDGATPGRKT